VKDTDVFVIRPRTTGILFEPHGIRNLKIWDEDMVMTTGSAIVLKHDVPDEWIRLLLLENLVIEDVYDGITDLYIDAATSRVEDSHLRCVWLVGCRNYNISLHNATLHYEHVRVYNNVSDKPGIRVETTPAGKPKGGDFIEDFYMWGRTKEEGVLPSTQHGVHLIGRTSAWVLECVVEQIGGVPLLFENGKRLHLIGGFYSHSHNDSGIVLLNSSECWLLMPRCECNDANGVLAKDCTEIFIFKPVCRSNLKYGLESWGPVTFTRIYVVGGHLTNRPEDAVQDYGINRAASSEVWAWDVYLEGNVVGPIGGDLAYVHAYNCLGFVSRNLGTATFTAGVTSVTVSHGLARTPKIVIVTPHHGEIADIRVTGKTAADFTAEVSTAPTLDRTFDWYAEV